MLKTNQKSRFKPFPRSYQLSKSTVNLRWTIFETNCISFRIKFWIRMNQKIYINKYFFKKVSLYSIHIYELILLRKWRFSNINCHIHSDFSNRSIFESKFEFINAMFEPVEVCFSSENEMKQWSINEETQALIVAGLCCIGGWVILSWFLQVRKYKYEVLIVCMYWPLL